MVQQVLNPIKQGDADTLTDTVTGLSSLAGYSAKLYIVDVDGEEVDTIDGTIDGLVITYEILNESSKAYPVGTHNFESKIFDSADHVYTTTYGTIKITAAIENDPS